MMNLPFLELEMVGYIEVKSLSATFFCKNANSSQMTTFIENPLAASDEEANARIDDMFANESSPLFTTVAAAFSHFGRYSYPVMILPRSSSAVAALFARSMIFFSGKKVASQSE